MTDLKRKAPSSNKSMTEDVIITKRGKQVDWIVQKAKNGADYPSPGTLQGTLIDMGDIVAPIDEPWDTCHEWFSPGHAYRVSLPENYIQFLLSS